MLIFRYSESLVLSGNRVAGREYKEVVYDGFSEGTSA